MIVKIARKNPWDDERRTSATFLARLTAKLNKTETCWLWTGATSLNGYGVTSYKKQCLRAHRMMYELTKGPIPDGMYVCHSCDVRLCCNPDHLFLGSHFDNMVDMFEKGRAPRGDHNGNHKLTPEQVLEIRRLSGEGLSGAELSRRFGISSVQVSKIVRRTRWAHLEDPAPQPLSEEPRQ